MPSKDAYSLTGSSVKRIARAVRMVEKMPQHRPRHQQRYPILSDNPPVVAKITSGTNPYVAVEVEQGAAGTWTTKTGGITWAATGTSLLYERNDNAKVPANTIVLCWQAYVTDDLETLEWVFDHDAQAGDGAPTHTAPEGTRYWDSTNNRNYYNTDGGTTWLDYRFGSPYDMLGTRVWSERAVTTTWTVNSSDFLGWTNIGSTGPYTGTFGFSSSGLDGRCWGFRCLPSFTGIATLDADGTEEFQGPRGSGAAVNRTYKMVKNEHMVLYSTGSHYRVVFETMLEVGFSAINSGAQSSIATATATKLTYDTERWDINDNFASSTHTPLAPGIYNYGGTVGLAALGDGKYCKLMLYKNGALHKTLAQVNNGAAADVVVSGACEVTMNGSTDYVELFVEHNHGGDLDTIGTEATSHFYGSRIRRDES